MPVANKISAKCRLPHEKIGIQESNSKSPFVKNTLLVQKELELEPSCGTENWAVKGFRSWRHFLIEKKNKTSFLIKNSVIIYNRVGSWKYFWNTC